MKPLFLLMLMVWVPACLPVRLSPAETTGATAMSNNTVQYEVAQQLTLINDGSQKPEKHNIWIALISDQPPFQKVHAREIQPANYVIVTDEYGNQFAEFDFKELDPGSSAQINVRYEVTVNELSYDLAGCEGDLPSEFTQPELHIESNNPQIIDLAAALSKPDQTVCEQAKSFYNYIGSNLNYTFNGADWGAQAALGKMGADCTEYSSLLIALSRAKGIPARYVEGLLFLNENNPVEARQEHAWAELYFPGTGWVPVDPTLGRSPLTREQHFARYSPNHIVVTNGRNPSTLRGASYWSHLYWPGDSTTIRIRDAGWTITPVNTSQAK